MPSTPSRTVVVTGAAGRLGRAACRELTSRGWHVRAFDRCPSPIGESIVADLADAGAVAAALRGADALVHLAATPDDDDFAARLLPDNLLGLHNVIEGARAAEVPRVILASSGQVNFGQQNDGPWPVRVGDPLTPRGWYAITKIALEAAGQIHARVSGFPVISVRLGWCPRTSDHAEELAASFHGPHCYLSPRDAGRFFAAAAEHPLPPGHHILYASSKPVEIEMLDLVPAKNLLDWEPLDCWPSGATDDLSG
ncbi:MAG: NAD(P)-dependent oxidoreductase [Planctomycetota bacterium]|nr:MAG: NAD(P)-dependent oxidoreductase [Planctomycetota bacterium]